MTSSYDDASGRVGDEKVSEQGDAAAMDKTPLAPGGLTEISEFGSNPGDLRMYLRPAPETLSSTGNRAPLVIALHGCSQDAASFDYGFGWSTLADRYGFALLMPEQQFSNNPNSCFTWYLPGDTRRGRGEAMSIKEMISYAVERLELDPSRVFIAGLSAGGAMTTVMLANYPEVFAGGAVFAGLPYGGARSLQDAIQSMSQGREGTGEQWSDYVFTATQHRGAWPKVSVWHGTADYVVNPKNADDILKQWTHVHGLPAEPHHEHEFSGQQRRVWRNVSGEDVIESITISGMGHGIPLHADNDGERFGNVSAFHFDVGLSAGASVAKFWGIAD